MNNFENIMVTGHEKNKKYLEKLWENNNFPRRLIFSGVKSIGKFSLSLLLAQKIVTKNEVKFSKYDQIDEKIYLDIMVIKEEDNEIISVNEVRKINDFVKMTSYQAKNKIIIIDNAENMNLNAQNSLLKIIEDSPIDNIFIIVAHSVSKLLPTIRSRMQEIKFFPENIQADQEILSKDFTEESAKNLIKLSFPFGFVKNWSRDNLSFIYEKIIEYLNSDDKSEGYFSFEKQILAYCKKKNLENNAIYNMFEMLLFQVVRKKFDFSYQPIITKEEIFVNKLAKKEKAELMIMHQKIIKIIADQKKYALEQRQTLYMIVFLLRNH